MSKNYEILLQYFPDNTKEGFKTEALPIIWEDKENFNSLMKKASKDMIKLASIIEDADDISGTVKKKCGIIVKLVIINIEKNINFLLIIKNFKLL